MKACPLKFDHPTEAQQLEGVGPKLCNRLADKLKAHCAANGLLFPAKAPAKSTMREVNTTDAADNPQPPKKKRKLAPYVPKLKSGAYALIMALGELDQEGTQTLSKAQLIEKAQPYCDSSFTTPSDPTKFYTAWKSMQTLETKELVCTRGHPTKKYCLSDDGWEVALRMRRTQEGEQRQRQEAVRKGNSIPNVTLASTSNAPNRIRDVDELSLSDQSDADTGQQRIPSRRSIDIRDSGGRSTASQDDSIATTPLVLRPGTFEVKMLLDSREIRTKTDRDYISRELQKLGVLAEIRALPLGDVLWVAKLHQLHAAEFLSRNPGDEDEGSDEVVLEHVIERKRLDDLIYSIKDGRFHEQKFRLKKSGMRYVTYLVEDYSISAERSDKYGEALDSVVASMQVVSSVFVKQTAKLDDTIKYLARMTNTIKSIYEKQELYVFPSQAIDMSTYLEQLELRRQQEADKSFCITFSAFGALCDKSDSLTLRDVYLKMLMCIRGVTGDKAIEIQKIWRTPKALIDAYERLSQDQKGKANMISDRLGETIPRKKVAKALSAKIAEVWAVGQAK